MASTALSPLSTSSLGTNTLLTLSGESETPDSPGAPSPETEFLTNLLHAVLSSDGNLPCPLPADFAAALLRNDDGETVDEAGRKGISVAEGVPAYPLYRHLGKALNEWAVTGVFPRTMEPMPGIAEDGTRKAKIDMWTPKVVELGSHLSKLRQGVEFQLHVQEPYFSQLKETSRDYGTQIALDSHIGCQVELWHPKLVAGKETKLGTIHNLNDGPAGAKTVEGKCASGAYNKIQAGDTLLFNQSLLLKVEDVKRYSTFQDMLEVEGLSRVLPGVASTDEGVQVYRAFYSEAKEQAGVLGIHVCHPSDLRQPSDILYDLLNELHMEGVRILLGMRSTLGSIDVALPPPTSVLLSSFLSVQHETLPGSKLTVGARALAKHVHRSSSGWWGVFTGTEPAKNKIAFKLICEMMEQAIWLNVHTVPVGVFEIRVQDGYGARWLADGSQFRGFLEPPMDEGYFNKWRH